MNKAYLMIGGNIGNREQSLSEARKAINANCGTIKLQSAIYETAAWGKEDQPSFLNQALALETEKPPEDLLHCLLSIEESMGRRRTEKYGPRIMDIDILFFNDSVLHLPHLSIPHPQIQNRRFVLMPLREIAPDLMHPVFAKTIEQLLAACTDPLTVHKFS